MQDMLITFPLAHFHAMIAAFEEQCTAQPEEVAILDFGSSYKLEQGYIVIEWSEDVSPTFVEQLTADSNVLDFTIFCIPCVTDDQLDLLKQARVYGRSQAC
jgi:hypothetical protein